MKDFLLVLLLIFSILIILLLIIAFIAWSAKKTLLTEQSAWSGKKLNIKRRRDKNSEGLIKDSSNKNLLKTIASQSTEFLKDEISLTENDLD